MNHLSQSNHFLRVLPLALLISLSSCSDDTPTQTKAAPSSKIEKPVAKTTVKTATKDKTYYKEMSLPVDKATWVEKSKFNKEFKKDCIARELNNAGSKKVDKPYIEKTCDCIADYMDDHLTDREADEFLNEDSHMRTLQIRYDTAAYHCISGSDKVSKPKVTRFPQ